MQRPFSGRLCQIPDINEFAIFQPTYFWICFYKYTALIFIYIYDVEVLESPNSPHCHLNTYQSDTCSEHFSPHTQHTTTATWHDIGTVYTNI